MTTTNTLNRAAANGVQEHPYGWVIVLVGTVCLILGFGANVSVSVLIKPLESEFGWQRAEVSMAYTMVSLGAAAGGIFWGTLSDRLGARPIALFGAICLSVSLMAVSQETDLAAFYTLYLIAGGLGFACLFTPILALVGLWFGPRKGLALGIVTAGGAIGQGVVPAALRLMISTWDWRHAMLYLGIAYLVILLPLLLLLKSPPAPVTANAPTTPGEANEWGLSPRVSLTWLSVAGVFCCICMAAPIIHLIPLGVDLGLDPATAVGLLMTLMLSGVAGRLFFGWLADRKGALYAYFLSSLAQTSTVFWFSQTGSLALLYALAVLFGFGFSGVMTCLIICAREAAPLRIAGLAVAVVTATAWVGMGIGGYQAGYFHDLTQNYTLSFANAAVAGLLNLAILLGLFAYRRRHAGLPVGLAAPA